MNRLLIVVGIIVAAFVAFFVARYFLEDGGDELSGTWAVVGMEQKGIRRSVEKLPFKALTFAKGKATWRVLTEEGEVEIPGPVTIDPSASPKQMDLAVPGPEGMERLPAIYETKGDEMRICLGVPRPREFSGRTGTLLVLKRQ